MSSDQVSADLEKGKLELSPSSTEFSHQQNVSDGEEVKETEAQAMCLRWLRMSRIETLTKTLRRVLKPCLPTAEPDAQTSMSAPKFRKLEDFPMGFPRLSCFLDSDDAFMVYRRFGTVFSRLLLNKQDEISQIEVQLNRMDRTDELDNNSAYLKSRVEDLYRDTIPANFPKTRPELLRELETKTLEYAELLLKYQQLKAISQPTSRDYKSVVNFMENDGGPLFERESQFIYQKEDLITLRPGREHTWLDGAIESLLKACRCKLLTFLFSSKETRAKADDADIHYYDRNRIAVSATLLITTIILVLLMVPIYLLFKSSVAGTIAENPQAIGIVLVPTILFSAALSAFTKAKRHEILTASAGYCAVLVVFLGNINGGVAGRT